MSGIIGKFVTWKHLTDGKPVVDFHGEVVAVNLIGADFRLLVLADNGELKRCDHGDVVVLDCFGEILNREPEPKTVADLFDEKKAFSAVAKKIDELGLLPAVDGMATSDAACHLLDTLMKELAESEAACEDLRNTLALVPEKKKPGRPKKEPTP